MVAFRLFKLRGDTTSVRPNFHIFFNVFFLIFVPAAGVGPHLGGKRRTNQTEHKTNRRSRDRQRTRRTNCLAAKAEPRFKFKTERNWTRTGGITIPTTLRTWASPALPAQTTKSRVARKHAAYRRHVYVACQTHLFRSAVMFSVFRDETKLL